jgi:hypothetical protein
VVLKPLEPTPDASLDLLPQSIAAAMRADSDLDRQLAEAELSVGLPRLNEQLSGAKEVRGEVGGKGAACITGRELVRFLPNV